jgi:GH24 family phage-related lysozyme (muramidase)
LTPDRRRAKNPETKSAAGLRLPAHQCHDDEEPIMSSIATDPSEAVPKPRGRVRRLGDRAHPAEIARAVRAAGIRRAAVASPDAGGVAAHPGLSTISPKGIAFIASFEGFSSKPYWDSIGRVWTIGFGETKNVTQNTPPIARAQAVVQLKTRVDQDYLAPVLRVAQSVGLQLRQCEADALASLAYNCGPGVCDSGRTMGNALRTKNRQTIADAFLVYDKGGNPPAVVPGLARRRRAERAMFLSG